MGEVEGIDRGQDHPAEGAVRFLHREAHGYVPFSRGVSENGLSHYEFLHTAAVCPEKGALVNIHSSEGSLAAQDEVSVLVCDAEEVEQRSLGFTAPDGIPGDGGVCSFFKGADDPSASLLVDFLQRLENLSYIFHCPEGMFLECPRQVIGLAKSVPQCLLFLAGEKNEKSRPG